MVVAALVADVTRRGAASADGVFMRRSVCGDSGCSTGELLSSRSACGIALVPASGMRGKGAAHSVTSIEQKFLRNAKPSSSDSESAVNLGLPRGTSLMGGSALCET